MCNHVHSIYWKVLLTYSRGGLGPSWRGLTSSHDEEQPNSVVIFDNGARVETLSKCKLQVDRIIHEWSQGNPGTQLISSWATRNLLFGWNLVEQRSRFSKEQLLDSVEVNKSLHRSKMLKYPSTAITCVFRHVHHVCTGTGAAAWQLQDWRQRLPYGM